MIAFVEDKRPDYDYIRSLLAKSGDANWWTNFGPVSRMLERQIASLIELPTDRRIVVCASGTVALHGLVNMFAFLKGRPLRWIVSAFTFHSQVQGPLADAVVLDCDDSGFFDREALSRLPDNAYDGIIVTNLFGTACNVDDYIALANRGDKLLIFDSATCFGSRHRGQFLGGFGDAECFSFHHTKPHGFGEGGCVAVKAVDEDVFRSIINFGLYQQIHTRQLSMNGKMSDVAGAFISDRLRHMRQIAADQREQFGRIVDAARHLGIKTLFDDQSHLGVPNIVPLLFPKPVPPEQLANDYIVLQKYYRPVATRPKADWIYSRIVSFPCHRQVAALEDDAIRNVLDRLSG